MPMLAEFSFRRSIQEGEKYLSFDDVEVDHADDHVEPDAVKHLQRAQQAVVGVVDVSHPNDHVTLEQRAP